MSSDSVSRDSERTPIRNEDQPPETSERNRTYLGCVARIPRRCRRQNQQRWVTGESNAAY